MKYILLIIPCILILIPSSISCEEITTHLHGAQLNEGEPYIEQLKNQDISLYSIAYLDSDLNIRIDKTRGLINYTPTTEETGEHTIILIGIGKDDCIATKLASFWINQKPRLTNTTTISELDEGGTIIFKATIEDDQNTHTYNWNLDGIPVSNEETYTYETTYFSAGKHEVTLTVTDPYNLTSQKTWEFNIQDVNQPPKQLFLLPDKVIYQNKQITPYQLTTFYKDPDEEPLTFTYTFPGDIIERKEDPHLAIHIDNETYVTITSTSTYTGSILLRFDATDPKGATIIGKPTLIGVKEFIPVCGDDICFEETCTSCPEDCGICNQCLEDWVCSDWENCMAGEIQTRTCEDLNACRNPTEEPEIQRICPNTCSDGMLNQDETNVDCGGICPPCPLCNDGKLNGRETDVDCGGGCSPCRDAKNCKESSDCMSKSCGREKKCLPATCKDNIKNQGEEGTDCGPVCGIRCPTCNDGIKNQGEEGTDCGIIACNIPCPSCNDGIKNQDEKGIDCGGPCRPCTLQNKTIITIGIIALCIITIILLIEIRHGYLFKALHMDTNIKVLSFLLQSLRATNEYHPRYKRITDNALQSLIKMKKEGITRSDLPDEYIKIINAYFDTVFELSGSFKEEQLTYKLLDYEIPYFARELITILYKNTLKFKETKYKTAIDTMERIDEATYILKSIRDVL